MTHVAFYVAGATFVGGRRRRSGGDSAGRQPRGAGALQRPRRPSPTPGCWLPSVSACDPLPLTGVGVPPPPSPVDQLIVAFDLQGQSTTATTSSPNQPLTAYLLLLSPDDPTALYGWEAAVEVETTGPAPVDRLERGLQRPEHPHPAPVRRRPARGTAAPGRDAAGHGDDLRAEPRPGDHPAHPAVAVSVVDPAAGLSGPGAGVGRPAGRALPRGGRRPPVAPRRRSASSTTTAIRRPPQVTVTGDPAFGGVPVGCAGHPHADVAQSRLLDPVRRTGLRRRRLRIPARQRPVDHRDDLVPAARPAATSTCRCDSRRSAAARTTAS